MIAGSGRVSAGRQTFRDCAVVPDGESLIESVGAVYTPPMLADWVAAELLRHVQRKSVLRVFDPACGDGELLSGIVRSYVGLVEVGGRDVDSTAVASASELVKAPGDFAVCDSLSADGLTDLNWEPDALIMNPPWNGIDSGHRKRLRGCGYELAQGQFDLYEIFVERVVKRFPGIPMAFILPDSVLLPEHEKFRRFLLKNTQLLLIARLGEGLFQGVYRGTVVVLARSEACEGGEVECFRLRVGDRKALLNNEVSLDDLRQKHGHWVPVSRFSNNPNVEFTIEVRSWESAVDKMLVSRGLEWDAMFWTGRGVEVGKNGEQLHCRRCGTYRPVPSARNVGWARCPKCGFVFPPDAKVIPVISRCGGNSGAWWKPIIVGEDVGRYRCVPSRELRLGLLGIQYKDMELLRKPKLLVRKTGVGLRCAVDRSGSLTTQTVYHFIVKDGVSPLVLDYLAGVLNSRVMLAFHLRWSGDSEWRSHPYVTQAVIKSLPVPSPFEETGAMSVQAQFVASLAQRRELGEMVDEDIDEAVADLYRLTESERCWVGDVIDSAQALQGIVELRAKSLS